ncbi:MAG: hypothetical protein ACYSTT_00795 [Planctomycetota bacterium]
MRRFWILLIPTAFLVLPAISIYACSTPVFRYAMERWPADYYDGVLIHKGPLADDDPASMLLQDEQAEFLNLRLSKIDLETPASEQASPAPAERLKQFGIEVPEELPALVLWYPWSKGRAAPFWTGQFTPATIKTLIQSAKRKELARRLTDGETAVWIFIESGTAAKDKAARQLIEQELAAATKELEEMAPDLAEELEMPGLSYKFSVLPVSRSDPKEKMFLEMLLKSEPDLDEYSDEPIVFPTFGRGRALFALVGEGINTDNLREAIAFITGPCGCEVKMLNPGVDLLMAENWDASVMQFYQEFYETAEQEPLPELTGVFPEEPADTQDEAVAAAISESPQPLSTPAAKSVLETPEPKVRGFGVVGMTAMSLAAILVAVGLGTLAVTKRNK